MRLLIAFGLLITMIAVAPILTILSYNWLLETSIPITSQTWVLVWAASLVVAIPILIFQFLVLRLVVR